MAKVEVIGPDDDVAWDAFVGGHGGATIYHGTPWREALVSSLGYTPVYLRALDNAGGWIGCLPLMRVHGVTGKSRLVATPFRDRGGALFDTPETLHCLLGTAIEIAGRDGVVVKSIDDYPDGLEALGFKRSARWVHSFIDFTDYADRETFWQALRTKERNAVRQAERAGLRFVELEPDATGLHTWYNIYQLSQRNLGLPPFPLRFFAALFAHLRGSARLFAIENNERRAVAATIVLLEPDRALYAYSASLPLERQIRPNDFMIHQLVDWCFANGKGKLDMGADAPSQAGLLFFKRKWLATQIPALRYCAGVVDDAESDSTSPRYDIARTIVRALPLTISRAILAPLVRYFG